MALLLEEKQEKTLERREELLREKEAQLKHS
jgi:hypothetical protein